ncbi:MAG: hypothetical protein AMXMBFR84_10170 [Candidatus Hydrogenedentota bacterium]
MDLSRFKWPVIILVVAGVFWLLSEGGINFMHKRFTTPPAQPSAEKDKLNENGLTRLGQFLIVTFRYQKATAVITDALRLFPEGEHALLNEYRLAKCYEKTGKFAEASNILLRLKNINANQYDERIPPPDVIALRLDKLVETHELGEIGRY